MPVQYPIIKLAYGVPEVWAAVNWLAAQRGHILERGVRYGLSGRCRNGELFGAPIPSRPRWFEPWEVKEFSFTFNSDGSREALTVPLHVRDIFVTSGGNYRICTPFVTLRVHYSTVPQEPADIVTLAIHRRRVVQPTENSFCPVPADSGVEPTGQASSLADRVTLQFGTPRFYPRGGVRTSVPFGVSRRVT